MSNGDENLETLASLLEEDSQEELESNEDHQQEEQQEPTEDNDIQEDNIDNDQGEQEQTEDTQLQHWLMNLADVQLGQDLRLSEYNQVYIFRRVAMPVDNGDEDPEPSNRFLVYCKDGDSDWELLNGMLSNRYVVASLELFINSLSGVTFEQDPIITKIPYKVNYFAETNNIISYFDDEASKMIFSFISGIDIEVLNNISSKLSLNISNAYDGTQCIRIDFVIHLSVEINNQHYEFKDLFTLGNRSVIARHTSSIVELTSDIQNIQQYAASNVEILKNHDSDIENITNALSMCYKKDGKEYFMGLIENLDTHYKNLFYILICASIALDKYYDIKQHGKLRTKVQMIFNKYNVFSS